MFDFDRLWLSYSSTFAVYIMKSKIKTYTDTALDIALDFGRAPGRIVYGHLGYNKIAHGIFSTSHRFENPTQPGTHSKVNA